MRHVVPRRSDMKTTSVDRVMYMVASLEKRHDQYLTKITKEARQHRAVHHDNNPNKRKEVQK